MNVSADLYNDNSNLLASSLKFGLTKRRLVVFDVGMFNFSPFCIFLEEPGLF